MNIKRLVSLHHNRIQPELLDQVQFYRMLHIEQKRSERSGRGLLLMLIEPRESVQSNPESGLLLRMTEAVANATRETDIKGWYQERVVLGYILTEIESEIRASAKQAISDRIQTQLASILTAEELEQFKISFYAYPDDGAEQVDDCAGLLPRAVANETGRRTKAALKRAMDVVGALFALALFSPFMMSIVIAIKLTSKGPIFFRQKRIGFQGREFTLFKFRSMYCQTDHSIHEEYTKKFISGQKEAEGVYKIRNDPRVTPLGKLLRRTSFDEFPQFFNVLEGTMSLVGPRPPLDYEVSRYGTWHKRRFSTVKPGVTGLWQVMGRSRVTFDEMVRLDIEYAKTSSIWLDFKILLLTPRAVLTGDGAY